MSARRRLPYRRDGFLFLAGVVGIGYQQATERYYVPLLVIYGLMAGVPGLAQLIIAIRALSTVDPTEEPSPGTPATPSPSSPFPSSSSSSSS